METVTLPQWMWWTKGECIVRIVKRGTYPDTVVVQLPNDVQTQVYLNDLQRQGAN